MLLPAYRNVKINSDGQHAMFVQELQSALRLTLGFSNNSCELLHICHVNIKLKLKLFLLYYHSQCFRI